MIKTQILMNKPVYLGLSILDLSKTVMYQIWDEYVKPKCGEKAKSTDGYIPLDANMDAYNLIQIWV